MLLKQKLKVLTPTESKSKGVIRPDMDGPLIKGNGDIDYLCGKCNHVIAKSVNRWDLERMVNAAFECYKCKKINVLQ